MEYSYRRDLTLSKLSLGTVQLGMDYGINNSGGKPGEAVSHDIIRTALDGGINILDTASAYGESEKVIGRFLKENPAYDPIVVTKCRVPGMKNPTDAEIEAALRGQVEASLQNLGISVIPFLLLHSENDLFDYGDAVPNTLKKLKAEKLIARAGASLSNRTHIDYIAQSDLYEAVQMPLNLMDSESIRDGGLMKLRAADKAVFIRSVFLQGLFFRDPDTLTEGVLAKAAEPLRKLRSLALEAGMSIAELAFSFVRDLDGVTSMVLGCETTEQVSQNLALMNAPKIPAEFREKMEIFDDIDRRIVMPWTWKG